MHPCHRPDLKPPSQEEKAVMHELARFVYYANYVFIAYFIGATLVYTCLMVLSLYSVSLHAKYAARKPYRELADSPVTPPVAVVIAAYNEEKTILDTVLCVLNLNYPEKEVIVVDDGSTDGTLDRLIERFRLKRMDLIYREDLKTGAPAAYYHNPTFPQLIVVSAEHGGKPHALNTGINMARSPYFCTVDADCVIEKDALLRLMAPVVHSREKVVVSGGIVRIANGCVLSEGRLLKVNLPKSWLELCQIVEYIRTFMFGRPGWNMLNATFIASGAFCILHRASVIGCGGFRDDTVTEDIDVIAALRRYLTQKKEKFLVVFTSDPICWTEAPRALRMLARQRRRWQLGMTQTLWANRDMIFNPKYGATGMLSMPFHLFFEVIGCVVEALGTVLIPLCLIILHTPLWIVLLFLVLSIGYGTLLSMGSVVMEEITQGRYPKLRHVMILMLFTVIENVGYRQIVTFFRAAGVLQAFRGRRWNRWEVVEHHGVGTNGAGTSELTGSKA
jgi:cellulose synthase/poly-beta-1,6-N-acetylglucosamine synthase-like glycosyltransferase